MTHALDRRVHPQGQAPVLAQSGDLKIGLDGQTHPPNVANTGTRRLQSQGGSLTHGPEKWTMGVWARGVTMGIEEILGDKREDILRIAAGHGATSVRVFGSVARGEADAERNAIFAEAYGADPEFFEFYRSLSAYEQALGGGNSSMVLSPDSDFFNYLKSPTGQAAQ